MTEAQLKVLVANQVRIELSKLFGPIINAVKACHSDTPYGSASIHELDINTRALNILNNANILTVGELASVTRSHLLKYRNCGKDTARHIEHALFAKYQITLAP